MNAFKNLKIAQKLIVGFLIMAVIATIIGVVGIIGNLSIMRADEQLYQEDTLGMQYAGNTAVIFMQIRYNCLKLINTPDLKDRETVAAEIYDNYDQMDAYLELCHKTIKDPAIAALLDKIQADWDKYLPMMKEDNEAALRGEQLTAKQELVDLGTALRDNFLKLFDEVAVEAGVRAEDNGGKALTTVIIVVVVVVVGIIVSLILGIYISRIIGRPLRSMSDVAKKLAVGDIDVAIELQSKDEIGELADSFRMLVESTKEQVAATKKIADGDLTTEIKIRSEKDVLGAALTELSKNLNDLVVAIISSSEQVASGSKLVSESSVALSQGATEQASSVQELTAALEAISEQTNLNAQNAQKANELAVNAKGNAEKGNIQMAEMLSAMEEINVSSANISKIIKVIDDIAFQTNILALNAAVEAARAGQHGKGFAVVAEEVRTLAAKSANAASETTEMIESSIRKVEAGTKIAKETAGALSEIVTEVTKVSDLVGSIAAASQEQKSGIEQINVGIQQVSQVVQSNAATSEESAAASEELSSQAEQLKEMVSFFKVKRYDNPVRSAAPAAAAAAASSQPKALADKSKTVAIEGEFGKY